jgi:hypothetical protein
VNDPSGTRYSGNRSLALRWGYSAMTMWSGVVDATSRAAGQQVVGTDRRRSILEHDAHAGSSASTVYSLSPNTAEDGAVIRKIHKVEIISVCPVAESAVQ